MLNVNVSPYQCLIWPRWEMKRWSISNLMGGVTLKEWEYSSLNAGSGLVPDRFDIALPQCPNLHFYQWLCGHPLPPLTYRRPPGHDGWKQSQHTISQHCLRTRANESIIWGWWWGTGVICLFVQHTHCLTSPISVTQQRIQHPEDAAVRKFQEPYPKQA